MCGIVGCVALNHKTIEISSTKALVDLLRHRGPDDAGYLYFHTGCRHPKGHSFYLNLADKDFNIYAPLLPSFQDNAVQRELNRHDWDLFFGHRRLAILDLSSAGHQPMSDLSQNIWLIYNGEIYNYLDLRKDLEARGHKFKSTSDSEVIIYAYVEWGIRSIEKFNGMFAFALYDNFKKKLFLARDRCGIKPLYYSLVREPTGWTLLFASEIKALRKYPFYSDELDYDGIVEYFSFQNFYTNRTLWKNAKILLPGHYLELDLRETSEGEFIADTYHRDLLSDLSDLKNLMGETKQRLIIKQYWDFNPFFEKREISEEILVEELREILQRAVKRHLISDVEIGAYLSGGLDSGALTAFASQLLKDEEKTLKTFTIGFDLHSVSGIEWSCDERDKAEYMSYLFKTEHYEMVLKAGDMERCLPKLVYHLEEPRVGQSYPNYYASMLASKFVKVVLSGCGGDELLGGYPWRYAAVLNSKNFDDFARSYYNYWLRLIPPNLLEEIFSPIKGFYTVEPFEIFKAVIPSHLRSSNYSQEEVIDLALYFDLKTFLHGLLLVEDKLSMAHSLESRVPFLDNEFIDFAMRIPAKIKIRNLRPNNKSKKDEIIQKGITREGKWLLRLLMRNYVSEEIWDGIKQGFSAPDNSWFRGDSIEFVKRLLLENKPRIYQYLNRETVQSLVGEHIAGVQNRRLLIWSLISFEIGLESWGLSNL